MANPRFGVAAVAVVLAAVACDGESKTRGGDDGASGTGGGSSVTAENYAERFAQIHCESLRDCCGAASIDQDLESCESTLAGLLGPALRETLARPSIAFDAEAAARCLEAYRVALLACDNRELAQSIDQACEDVIRGVVPEGGLCVRDDECAPSSMGSVLCDEGVCRRPTDDVPPVHKSRAGLGQACNDSCTEGTNFSWCSDFVSETMPLASCWAEDGLYCSTAHVCELAPEAGAPCPTGACGKNSYCLSGTCIARSTTGPCDVGYECLSTSHCDFDTLFCISNKANGESCIESVDCQSGYCAGDSCRDWSLANPDTCAGTETAGVY